MCVEVRGQLVGIGYLLCQVGPRDWTQVLSRLTRLCDGVWKYLHLSYLTLPYLSLCYLYFPAVSLGFSQLG